MIRNLGAIALAAGVAGGIGGYGVAQNTGGVQVCVGADRVLRFEPSERCPAGQTMYRLVDVGMLGALAPSGQGASQSPQPGASPKVNALEQKLDALDQKLTTVSHRVTAPFEVVDDAGKAILAVGISPRGLQVMNSASQIVATVAANPDGGYFRGNDPTGTWIATIGVKANTPQALLKKGGTPLGALIADGGKPAVQLFNNAGVMVSNLAVGPGGAGYLQLTNPTGGTTVEAGTVTSGIGVVRVGPRFNCSGKMGLVVPDCISGHQ